MELLNYTVLDAGWADFEVHRNDGSWSVGVSYLHDSLGDLACLAVNLSRGARKATAIFLQEPGEHRLIVRVEKERLHFWVREYPDWMSWGIGSLNEFTLCMHGEVSRQSLIVNVTDILHRIYLTMGPDEYKRRWAEHEFPIRNYQWLMRNRNQKETL